MKSALLSLLAFTFLTVSAEARTRSTSDHAELKSFVAMMSTVASEGASLAAFEYIEGAGLQSVRTRNCQPIAIDKVVRSFEIAVETVSDGGGFVDVNADEFNSLRPVALQQFRELVGSGPYMVCEATVTGGMAYTRIETFHSPEYSFGLELGFED